MSPETIGLLAGLLTTTCFIPQAIKVIRCNDTKSISLTMYIIFFIGVSLWLLYGITIDSFPVILWNALVMPLVAIILYKKIQNVRKKID